MQFRFFWDLLIICFLVLSYAPPANVTAHPLDSRVIIPSPIVVAASQDFDGNDGPWSSFEIQVGTPSQNLKIFISTSGYQTLVVVPEGCVPSYGADCASIRGGDFHLNQSSTWITNTANLSSNIYDLEVDSSLGIYGKAELGFDDITLGWQGSGGPSLRNQTVGGFAAPDFWLGFLGLSARASNFTSFDNPIPSYMQNLRTQNMIPSTSWSYTAGNQYRLNHVLGSLTLGGYDASKFIPNGVSFPFDSEDIRDLTVQLESITMSDSTTNSLSLLATSIPAFVDSSLPYIWLPIEACTLFEKAFGLTWNNETELYLLNDSQHNALLSQNASVTFTLGNLTAGANVNITLPYDAFDLTVSSPIVSNSTKYFPLKRAANNTQYTLGRTFFQEAYVITDYDRRSFSVSQCNWEANAQQDIISILPPSNALTSGNGTSSNNSGSAHTTPIGAIAGGVVGGTAIFAGIIILVYHFCIKPRRRNRKAEIAATQSQSETHPPGTKLAPEAEFIKPELDTQEVQRAQEMEAERNGWAVPVETDGNEVNIYELPAEEVAAEMTGLKDPVEMATPSEKPPPRWSWVTSPGGTTPGGWSEGSPRSATISEESPQSLRAQLARLPE